MQSSRDAANESDGEGDEVAAPKAKKADGDDDEDDAAGEDDGNIRLGTRKPVKGYDDGESSSSEDSDGLAVDPDEDVALADVPDAPDASPSVGKAKSKSKQASRAVGAELGDGIRRCIVPPSVAKNRLFGDCLYSSSEAWVEVVVNYPPSARKV